MVDKKAERAKTHGSGEIKSIGSHVFGHVSLGGRKLVGGTASLSSLVLKSYMVDGNMRTYRVAPLQYQSRVSQNSGSRI